MIQIKTSLALITVIMLSFSGCGKRQPPLPPVERVTQKFNLSGYQQGDSIFLSWKFPLQVTAASKVKDISRVDVYRLVEPISSPLSLTEDDFASQSTIIGSTAINQNSLLNGDFSYTDKLIFASQPVRIRYAIRLVNSVGQKAAFSNFVLIEPAPAVASNPTDLETQTTQNAINLFWKKPTTNIDGSSPANLIGYNVYKKFSNLDQTKKITSNPISKEEFSDRQFEFGKMYEYFVRAVSVGLNGEPIESQNSNVVELTPKDVFPPSAPTALTIAASADTISIFFALNPEPDVVGYKIYRSSNPELPKEKWTNISKNLLVTNTFQDTEIETGKTFYYYIVAVDKFGNISKPSEVISETIPN